MGRFRHHDRHLYFCFQHLRQLGDMRRAPAQEQLDDLRVPVFILIKSYGMRDFFAKFFPPGHVLTKKMIGSDQKVPRVDELPLTQDDEIGIIGIDVHADDRLILELDVVIDLGFTR